MEQFIPLIVIGGLMYLVLILPQQRRTREHKALLASLQEGDEVLMNSGIHGFVSAIDGDILWIEVAADTELKVARSAIAAKIDAGPDTVEADSVEPSDTVDPESGDD